MFSQGNFITLLAMAAFLLLQLQVPEAQEQLPPWTPEKEEAIEAFIEHTLGCRHVVGLSLAIVYDGDVRMTMGYGYEDIEDNKEANENSLFCIGSLTKAFTSTLWGTIMDESDGEYHWDTLVKDVMGEDFKLAEEVRTERATVRDLLAHKMCLAYYGANWWLGLPEGPSRQEYCSRLQFLEAHTGLDFRQQYTYNNFMYMLMSCMAEKLTGMEFEDIVQEKIFDKLNMNSSVYISAIQNEKERVPTQYIWNYKTETMDRLDPDLLFASVPPSEASGGICSPAVDMAKWMLLALEEGRFGDSEVLNEDIWRDTTTPQFTAGDGGKHRKPFYPAKKESMNYGLGWEIGDYREYRRVSHSGFVGGFNSLLSTYPDMKLAIFTNTNGDMDTYDFHEALHIYTADVVLEENIWLNDTTACTYPDPWRDGAAYQGLDRQAVGGPLPLSKEASQAVKGEEFKEIEPVDGSWLKDNHERYVGHYGHLLLGNLTVYYNESEDMLWGTAGRIGIGRLTPFNVSQELFLMEMWDALWWLPELGSGIGSYPPIRFRDFQDGEYNEIVGIAYDPQTPPIFVRGLQWDDLPEDDDDGDRAAAAAAVV